jgi:hypothetical protein
MATPLWRRVKARLETRETVFILSALDIGPFPMRSAGVGAAATDGVGVRRCSLGAWYGRGIGLRTGPV